MLDAPKSPAHPLAQSHAEILERALATNAAARAAVEQAMDLVTVAQALQREREYWRQILEGLHAGAERLIPVCAYCDRVRAGEVLWERIPHRSDAASSQLEGHGCHARHLSGVRVDALSAYGRRD
jgi:hypothetical protein